MMNSVTLAWIAAPSMWMYWADDDIQSALNEAARWGIKDLVLAPGIYHLDAGLKLNQTHSGIRLAAAVPGTVILRGSVPLTEWKTVTDPFVLKKLGGGAAQVRVCDSPFPLAGLTYTGFSYPVKPIAPELFSSSGVASLAQFPNEGYAYTGKVTQDAKGDPTAPPRRGMGAAFKFSPAKLREWSNARNGILQGYWGQEWADQIVNFKIADSLIQTFAPHPYGYKGNHRFKVLNLLEELDRPNEVVFAPDEGKVYAFQPLGERELSRLTEPIIEIKGASDVTIENLVIEGGRGNGIQISDSIRCVISNTEVSKVGNVGIDVQSNSRVRIAQCAVRSTGAEGIVLRGGDRERLTEGAHVVENSTISDFGRWWKTYHPGIYAEGVGHTIRGNEIFDGPHSAILYRAANDLTIERNSIHDVCKETGDAGAIYAGRDWTIRGVRIVGNHFKDIRGWGSIGAQGVYLDDGLSGTSVEGNLFENVQRALLLGGGRDNVFRGNLVIGCDQSILADSRGESFMKDHIQPTGTIVRLLLSVPTQSPEWRRRYPQLAQIDPATYALPVNNRIESNVFIGSGVPRLDGSYSKVSPLGKNTTLRRDQGGSNLSQIESRTRRDRAGMRIDLQDRSPGVRQKR